MSPPQSGKTRSPEPILFAHYGNDWIRGSEQCLLDLVKYIDRTRFTPIVICNWPVLAQAAESLGVRAIVHSALAPSGLVASGRRVAELRDIVREHGIKLIHVNASLLTPLLVRVARTFRIPLLAHLHIVPTAEERRHELLHQMSVVIGVSRASVDGFADDGMPQSRIRIIYNGVDGDRISKGSATGLRGELGIPSDAITLGTISSLIHRKGVDLAIAALPLVRASGVNAHLIVVGNGEEREALLAQAQACGMAAFAHFIGERRDAGAVVRDAIDIGLSPSREEAFPLNVLEVGYFAKPIVVSNIPPHWEGVQQDVTGIIVSDNTPVHFAEAVALLARDEPKRRGMGLAAQVRVEREFTVERNVAQFENIYDELLQRPAWNYGWIGGTRWPRIYNRWAIEFVRKRLGVRRSVPG